MACREFEIQNRERVVHGAVLNDAYETFMKSLSLSKLSGLEGEPIGGLLELCNLSPTNDDVMHFWKKQEVNKA